MDLIKIGRFLKSLRCQKGLTQEELAEHLYVSGRTVSRWETGHNMPDIGTLVELADFFDVGISEIINGERKSENMNEEEKETLLQVAHYSDSDRGWMMKRVLLISVLGLCAMLTALLFAALELANIHPVLAYIEGCCFGIATGALIACILFSTGVLAKIKSNPRGRKIAHIVKAVSIVVVIACFIGCVIESILH